MSSVHYAFMGERLLNKCTYANSSLYPFRPTPNRLIVQVFAVYVKQRNAAALSAQRHLAVLQNIPFIYHRHASDACLAICRPVHP
ncbi:hypothetical protein HETIRDRAFT_321425 [Heterobasidion irregulare TC 32-1]|uniref:Uncharacterized protein n=1 Tax=Heterobasidion irregulare (strain TC 32-1) TaxID=747525 RepID=W4K1E5_HETIT|nr:uncharacterized protein HETIRDRAFT_321425 [Heterobasidion irregulare TC 32-1]ETW79632.1 hypothetical protein HETIRDRAFT_321425 [Heterobasidion irregulare TC 32-1]